MTIWDVLIPTGKGKLNLATHDKANWGYLEQIEKEAQEYHDKISKNWKLVDAMYNGDQWLKDYTDTDADTPLKYNARGQVVFDFESTYDARDLDNPDKPQKPKRVLNVLKANIRNIVSILSEVEPFPVAKPKNPYSVEEDLLAYINKVNLIFDIVLKKENQWKQLYPLIIEKSQRNDHCFVKLAVNQDKAKTIIPIKVQFMSADKLLIDPRAFTLEDADYVIEKFQMRYGDLKERFHYEDIEKQLKEVDEEKPTKADNLAICDLKRYWLRIKHPKKVDGFIWFTFVSYNNQWLKQKDDKGEPMENQIYNNLPFVAFHSWKTETWAGCSSIPDTISSQIELNKNISNMDWNVSKYNDPPTKYTGNDPKSKELWDNNNRPGGFIPEKANEQYTPMSVTLVPTQEYLMRNQSIVEEINKIIGNQDFYSGKRPEGVTSNAMLVTMQRTSQMTLSNVERLYIDQFTLMCEKLVDIVAEWMGSKSLNLYDYMANDWVNIKSVELTDARVKIEIDTNDSNLMTMESKFDSLMKIMQYYPQMTQVMPTYHVLKMIDNTMPGFVPKEALDVADSLREVQVLQIEVQKKTLQLQSAQLDAQLSQVNGQQPSTQEGEEQYVLGEKPEPMPDDTFNARVDEELGRLIRAGIPERTVNEFQTIIQQQLEQGLDKDEIVLALEAGVSEVLKKATDEI